VVVIHHRPGYDRAPQEIVRQFAELGYQAIRSNLHHRQAPGAAPDDAAATTRAAGGSATSTWSPMWAEHTLDIDFLAPADRTA
jgi:dienelactone hydrolase